MFGATVCTGHATSTNILNHLTTLSTHGFTGTIGDFRESASYFNVCHIQMLTSQPNKLNRPTNWTNWYLSSKASSFLAVRKTLFRRIFPFYRWSISGMVSTKEKHGRAFHFCLQRPPAIQNLCNYLSEGKLPAPSYCSISNGILYPIWHILHAFTVMRLNDSNIYHCTSLSSSSRMRSTVTERGQAASTHS